MKYTLTVILLGLGLFANAQSLPTLTSATKLKVIKSNEDWYTTLADLQTYFGLSGGGTVTSFSSGNLSPLFTTSVATATTTPALSFTLSNAGANTYLGNATGSTATPSYTSAGALTKTDDTNVTLTLGGSPTVSLLAATSLTLGWTGQLAVSRGGTGLSALGSDGTVLGSNGSANVYLTPAVTTNAASIAYTRSGSNLNLNIPDADASNRGTVSTGTQTFAGAKTFNALITGGAGVTSTSGATQASIKAIGVISTPPVSMTDANYTADHTQFIIRIPTLTAARTISLPACTSTTNGWTYTIIKVGSDSFGAIIDPNSTETFADGASTKTIYSQNNSATCTCDFSNTSWIYKTN